ncbi:MAG: AAA family ATPase [Chromatiales bacterium]|nr:AAA family ATPase [Chromatiales bacterium]
MYTRFFGLNEKPFAITPDPRYLYLSERHGEALAHLVYGVTESGGFIQLTGEVGTGKTTLVRSLLQQLPDTADVALVLNPQLSRTEFLAAICEELRVPLPAERSSIKALTDTLNQRLLENHAAGRRTILIVDEAQNLRVEVLEQVRLLTNLETATQKLLQIILIGQPELREVLARTDMRQLAQRITGRYHLEPLTREETAAYVDHRLKVAGGLGQIFTPGARRALYRVSGGIPRMINVVADRALLAGYTRESQQITPALVRAAAAEVLPGRLRWRGWPARLLRPVPVIAACAILLAGSGWMGARYSASSAAPPTLASGLPETAASRVLRAPELEPVTVPPTRPLPLPALLAATADQTGTDSAFATLFSLWGIPFEPGGRRACEQAEDHDLHCLYQQRGSLGQVRNLDLPVILTLRDDGAEPHQVVLAGLDDEYARLRIGEREFPVSSGEIYEHWFGEYLLLWRPRISEVKAFVPGMRDPEIRWLRESLAAIEGRPVEPMDSEVYDAALEARVRAYQRERLLTVDGLAGQQTQIAIDADLGGPDHPRLMRNN